MKQNYNRNLEMFEGKRVLTGVKPTGKPHVGNYFGAIKPAIELAANASLASIFIADYHAINAEKDATRLDNSLKEVAAVYLAAGLDPKRTNFYNQSDVAEIFEFATIISAYTPKGFMNKSHAYKAAVDKNAAAGKPNDDGINMGLYTYPTLMAADILTMDTDVVPVGRDQVQHVEIARDIAGAVNAVYDREVIKVPTYALKESVAVVPGTDGRKMSKSYNNVIPMYEDDAVIKKAVFSVQTDSRPIEEPKMPESVLLYDIYKSIAPDQKVVEMAEGLREGKLGYGHCKNMLLDAVLEISRAEKEKFDYYMAHFDEVRGMLEDGASRARIVARPVLDRLKNAVFGR